MKTLTFKITAATIALTAIFCFGCGGNSNSVQNQTGEIAPNANQAGSTSSGSSTTSAASSPCANKYYPVKAGLQKNYKNSIGGDTAQVIEYADGASQFTEVMTLKGVNVKHVWNCTSDGLIASNYGSMANMNETKIEPKHISGVTVPNDGEMQIGKMWTTVYQGTGTSPLGAVDEIVTLNNKVVALDDEVKTPVGAFKALKIESDILVDMKFGGKKMPVPNVKMTSWYAPDIGMVKSTGNIMGMTNTMEYKGGN